MCLCSVCIRVSLFRLVCITSSPRVVESPEVLFYVPGCSSILYHLETCAEAEFREVLDLAPGGEPPTSTPSSRTSLGTASAAASASVDRVSWWPKGQAWPFAARE